MCVLVVQIHFFKRRTRSTCERSDVKAGKHHKTIFFLLNKVCACVYNKRDIFKKVKFYKHVYSNTIN